MSWIGCLIKVKDLSLPKSIDKRREIYKVKFGIKSNGMRKNGME